MAGNTATRTYTIYIAKLKIGDYVDYKYKNGSDTYQLSKTYSGYTSNQEISQDKNIKWRILNIDENNKVDLISAEPTSQEVYFRGFLGYNNGVDLLNDICEKLYGNNTNGIEARSINLKDMETHLTDTGFAKRNSYVFETGAVQYGNFKTFATSLSYYPNKYANQIGSGINTATVAKPNIINTVDPYNESKYMNKMITGYSQANTNGLTITNTFYSIEINEENYGEAANVLKSTNLYWIAANAVGTTSKYICFEIRGASKTIGGRSMYDSHNYPYSVYYRLRPIISFNNGIVIKGGNGTEDIPYEIEQ